jgi:rhodanese-related sulfurtransferase
MEENIFEEIGIVEFQELINKNVAVFDIRRETEFEDTGIIENTIPLTFFDSMGNHNIAKWLGEFEKVVTSKDQPVILVCAHANRTKIVGNYLSKQMNYSEVYDLEGGITSWLSRGLETVKHK